MSLPEFVSFPSDREKLFNALERFDNGVTEEDVVGKDNEYNYHLSNTALVQVLVDFLCHAFVKKDDLRRKLVLEVCKRLSPYKIVNDQLFLEENNHVRIAIKSKVVAFMKQLWDDVCPGEQLDASVLKYLESNNLSADFELYYRNNFTELNKIGHGGFGTVFKVESKEDAKVYAVKKILFNYKNDESFIKVIREVKNLSTLDHQNTISYKKAWLEITPNGHNDSLNKSSMVSSSADESSDKSDDEETQGIVIKDISDEGSDSIIFQQTDSVENFKGTLPSMDSKDYISFSETDNTVSEGEIESVDCSVAKFSSCPFNLSVKGILYIQMEYCDCDLGLWLNKRAEGAKLPFEMDIFCMFTDILNGISYIHAKGIIHRDLKPRNIFYSSTENVLKIGDFGLATLPQNPTDPFNAKVPKHVVHSSEVGTMPYAAPEQINSKHYSTKVDMFSLGIILIELMNTCGTYSELVKVIEDVKKGIITEEMKQFPRLGKLVKNLVNKEPQERMSATDVIKMMMSEVKTFAEKEKKMEERVMRMEKKTKSMEEKLKSMEETILDLQGKITQLQ